MQMVWARGNTTDTDQPATACEDHRIKQICHDEELT